METSTVEDVAAAARIASEAFGVAIDSVEPLPGDLDRNFVVTEAAADGPERFVLKLFTSAAPRATVEFQRDLLEHAIARAPELERVLPRFLGEGDRIPRVMLEGREVDAVLLRHVEGRTLARVKPHAPALLREVGATLGVLDRSLAEFERSAT